MNDETKIIYTTLQDILKNTWEQQKYSEIKNGVMLTFSITILVIIGRTCLPIPELININIINKVIFIGLLFFLIVHIFYVIHSFFPKDKKKEDFKYTNDEINIFFFGDIQKLQNKQYLDIVIDKFNIKKQDINEILLLDLSNQIVKLSEITQFKYSSFKHSIYRMYTIAFLFTTYFLYIYFTK